MATSSKELDALAQHPLVAQLIASFAERPGQELVPEATTRLAAILLALRAREDGEPEILMIKRAEAEGDPWSGHIACPGGRMDPGDHDLAATALRETWEETGIDLTRDGRLLGHLDDLSPRSKLLPSIIIRPYVGLVGSSVEMVLSSEVASAFWVPIAALRSPDGWRIGDVSVQSGARRVSLFQHGEHTVWGLTERALRQFLSYMGCPLQGESVDEDV